MTSPPDAPDPLDAKATRRGWMAALGVSLGTAFLIISPFFWRGTASGHDIAFHASSWLDVAGQWKEGIVFPRWCEWANNGFGERRFIFFPAFLLAALQRSGLMENRWGSGPRSAAIFGLFFAAIWLANAPAGVLASYSMALLFAWAAISEKSFLPLLRGAGGLALGFGLACFYLVPAAYEQRWVNIGEALSSGLRPVENFLFTKIADPEHNLFNWIASSVAILLKLLTWIAAALAYRNITEAQASWEKKALWQSLIVLGAAATLLMLRPSAILWEYLPELRFVQFPWRWMGILALAYACFGAAAVAPRRVAWIWSVVVILAMAGTATFLVSKAWWDSDDIPSLQEAISSR